VDEERKAALEPQDEVLPAPLDRDDAVSLELLGDLEQVDRPRQPRVEDLDAHERAPGEPRRELGADGLDLRKLGHLDILSTAHTIRGMPTITIRDESRPGRTVSELELPDLPDRITLRELLRTRVREEVAKINLHKETAHHMLVQPADAEVTLNGYRLKEPRTIDWERQAEIAEEAFGRNGYFVIVDDRQVDSLDDELELTADSEVRFLKLTPLVGG
jgi:hypothetical protein